MSNIAQYSDIIDRNLDRWQDAIEAARASTYSSGQFAHDVAESWADWALFAALPFSVFGVNVALRPAVPTVEFIVTSKTSPMTQVVEVPQINNVTSAVSQNLNRPGTTALPFIPAARVAVTLAGTDYLYITLDVPGIAALTGANTVTANVYSNDVLGMPANVGIAHVKVVWPG